ncbi:ribosome biogenesis GTPase YlqF [Spiroplasma taiwanense]|uniref:Ribosome biogenesis GTPase A n=1 Tax=Spiroplasma taiwanense CT-1 TaxID=1276220 RepID=S5MGI8_9MOLU|nr:ribosome biogenesis GTPase YlqF [Spiroplasma taiwanense]AGR40970.1 ribosomal biogenesis GTPase [Spiroplasma taiwanense CT-1]
MFNEKSSFNWFPGHMNKSIKEIESKISIVDLVIEIVDARSPFSTQNSLFRKLLNKRPRLIIMSKFDLADVEVTNQWFNYFLSSGNKPYLIKDKQADIYNDILKLINEMTKENQNKQIKRGIEKPQLNVLVVGIPNVGKSTVISKLSKGKTVKIGNKPGVTRGLQRIVMTPNITLIDTPGILPSKFENETIACNCAATNSIKLEVVPKERLATKLMRYIYNSYPDLIENTYKINKNILRPINYDDTFIIFEEIAKRNKFTIFDNMADVERAIELFVHDIINNNLGRISFEKPIEISEINKKTIDETDLDFTVESDLTVEW